MTPVSELTLDQAVAELEQIADAKPTEEQVIERAKWHKQYSDRIAALEERINTEAAPDPEEPKPEALAAPAAPAVPKRTPSELLELKVKTYLRVHGELVATPADKALRNHLNVVRFAVRDLVQRIGCQMPELPAAPESPFGHKPRKPMKAEPHRPVGKKAEKVPQPPPPAPIEEAPIEDAPLAPAPPSNSCSLVNPDVVRNLINQLRTTGKAIQGLAVLLSPWGNETIVEQMQPQGLAAVAELMAIVGLHVEAVADDAERVA